MGRGLVLLVQGFQPHAHVHPVAHHRVVEELLGAQVPDDHLAGVDPDSDPEGLAFFGLPFRLERFHLFHHRERGPTCTLGVVRQRHGRSEDRHDRVADEFVEGPPLGQDLVRHAREELAEHVDHFLGRMPLGVPCEVPDVGEEHRQVPDLPAKLQGRRVVGELLDHLRADEALKRALRPQTLALLRQDAICRDAHESQGHGEARIDQRKPQTLEERQMHSAVEGGP